ncbi:hypothetical protein MHLP_03110 [Candidatus Mycoplasma haematolamae str. Purdue]|uniref:Uncharacterized protein n=1 Tax=Mycoplasma haematolamae (strain Purdue) TaxID=1212765 RepID=I7C6P7_MYCHA|nr:hypothetical protein [Candidatus Mycoplasma haematolamae]AFO52202.1 hypothetical protein MHLP_03110 [Candidatus Mycoplasma haematolamae str. Purdue]
MFPFWKVVSIFLVTCASIGTSSVFLVDNPANSTVLGSRRVNKTPKPKKVIAKKDHLKVNCLQELE